jgi:predicted DsbA family dithiol-disulfide isomerase
MLARETEKQLEAKEAFMKAYFEDGVDLTKKENLVAIATDVGLNQDHVNTLLDSDDGIEAIEKEEQTYQQRGVRGVPFFIINNQYGISGAQPADVLAKAIRQIAAEAGAN